MFLQKPIIDFVFGRTGHFKDVPNTSKRVISQFLSSDKRKYEKNQLFHFLKSREIPTVLLQHQICQTAANMVIGITIAIATAIYYLAQWVVKALAHYKRPPDFPPGPSQWPILGSVPYLPKNLRNKQGLFLKALVDSTESIS